MQAYVRRLFNDVQGFFVSLTTVATALIIMNSAGLMSGQAVGLAYIFAHFTGLTFGQSFFLVNLPFYLVGLVYLGKWFILRTFVSITLLSILVDFLPNFIQIDVKSLVFASVLFGVLAGIGLLGVIRHGASLGGGSILAVVAQERFGLRAGYVQLGLDVCIFAVGAFILEPHLLFYSFVGSVVLNLLIAWNHIPGRYNSNV